MLVLTSFAACVGGARRPSLNNDLHRRLLTGKCLLYFSQTFFFTFFFIWLYLAKLHPPGEPKEDKTNTLELTNKASSALEHETFMNLAWKSDFHVIRSKGDFRPIARRGFLHDRNQHFYVKKNPFLQQVAADEYLLFYCCSFGLYKTSFGVHILLQPLHNRELLKIKSVGLNVPQHVPDHVHISDRGFVLS